MNINGILEIFLCIYFVATGVMMVTSKKMNGNMYFRYTEESLARFAPRCGIMYIVLGLVFAMFALQTNQVINIPNYKVVSVVGCAIVIILGIAFWIMQKKMLVKKDGVD